MKSAHTSADYRELARYFHYQQRVFREKASEEWRECAKYYSRYHPKVATYSEHAEQLFYYYSAKAEEHGRQAAKYDRLLKESGSKPVRMKETVSFIDLAKGL